MNQEATSNKQTKKDPIEVVRQVVEEVASELEEISETKPGLLDSLETQQEYGHRAAVLRGKAEVISRLGELGLDVTPDT